MTLLLTHNDWCVGEEGAGVAIPCCSSWFQCHSCTGTNLGRGWTRVFWSLCFTMVWSFWSCSDLPALLYETRELLGLPDSCFRLNSFICLCLRFFLGVCRNIFAGGKHELEKLEHLGWNHPVPGLSSACRPHYLQNPYPKTNLNGNESKEWAAVTFVASTLLQVLQLSLFTVLGCVMRKLQHPTCNTSENHCVFWGQCYLQVSFFCTSWQRWQSLYSSDLDETHGLFLGCWYYKKESKTHPLLK